jgi:hypothetical protein
MTLQTIDHSQKLVQNQVPSQDKNRVLPIEDGQRNFDFQPEQPWPSLLPVYCYENELLCGFDRTEGVAIQLSTSTTSGEFPLICCFKALYSELGFFELARLSLTLPPQPGLRENLWQQYGFRWRETLQEVVEKVTLLPLKVQQWLQTKKLGPQDLAPLRALPNIQALGDFWPQIIEFNLSKSETARTIELLVDLLLMDVNINDLLPQTSNEMSNQAQAWINHLHALRFPMATKQSQQAEEKIRQVAWPLKSEARWSRRGDRSGVELKLYFSHPQELKRSLDRLQQVCEDLQTQPEYEDLWSKN